MADLIKVKAKFDEKGSLTWSFLDEDMRTYGVQLIQPPGSIKVCEGDVWQVEQVEVQTKGRQKIAVVRLIVKEQKLKSWEKISQLPNFEIGEDDLRSLLIWLNNGTNVMLIGNKGTGKTTLGFAVCEALGWQQPYKVDVYTMKKTTDLFGTNSACNGTTRFVQSGLAEYITRAVIAEKLGLKTQFMVILDEINRVHAKTNESMHGLFDDTRQVTFITTDGSQTVILPPNIHILATMNFGDEFFGTHGVDAALKDRFAPMRIREMSEDFETKKLVREIGILESQALKIVQVARNLRKSERAGFLSFSPSYRGCRDVARLVLHGMDFQTAIVKGFLTWYEGELDLVDGMVLKAKDPNSEIAKAYSAMRKSLDSSVH